MGKFYRGGKLWSSEAFRLAGSVALTDTSVTSMATQAGMGDGTNPVSLVSSSLEDDVTVPATYRTLVGTVGGSVATSDVIRLATPTANYDYTILEGDNANAVFAALATAAAADTNFTVANGTTQLNVTAKVAGTVPNAYTVTLSWTTGSGTANLANTPAVASRGGTGARTVKVEFLDAEGRAKTETVSLNGTTPVTTTLDAIWVQRITVASCGSSGTSVGSIEASIDEVAQVAIEAGEVQSGSVSYLVPTGKQLILTSGVVSSSAAARVRVMSNYDPETGVTFASPGFVVVDTFSGTVPATVDLPYGLTFPAGTTFKATAQGTNGTNVSVAFCAFLEAV